MVAFILNKFRNVDEHFKEVLIKGTWSFVIRAGGAIAIFIMNVYLARLLNAEGFGLFSLAFTIIGIALVFSKLGLDTALLRDISKNTGANISGYARAITDKSLLITFIASLFITLLLVYFLDELSMFVFDKPALADIIFVMIPCVIFMTPVFMIAESLKGIRNTANGVLLQNTLLPIIFLILLTVVNIIQTIDDPIMASIVYSLAALITMIFAFIIYFKIVNFTSYKLERSLLGLLLKGIPLLLIASSGLVLSWTDIIVLGVFETESNIGIYTAAVKISLLTSFILVAINSIFAPKISRFHAQKDYSGLRRLTIQSTRLMVVLAAPPTVFILIFPDWFLLFFGAEFSDAVFVLMILTIGQLVNVVCGPTGYILIMTGHDIIMKNILLCSAIVNIILSVILVNLMGIEGVAISTAISIAIWNVAALVYVRKKLGFWTISLR